MRFVHGRGLTYDALGLSGIFLFVQALILFCIIVLRLKILRTPNFEFLAQNFQVWNFDTLISLRYRRMYNISYK